MSAALFELLDFAPPAPQWAEECFYCSPDPQGYYDEAKHLASHLQLTCAICGGTSPNRMLFTQSHNITLGGSWGRDALMCSSFDLTLNHLRYAITRGETPAERNLQTLASTGWLLSPTGDAVRPRGWPTGLFAYSCGIALSRERGAVSN